MIESVKAQISPQEKILKMSQVGHRFPPKPAAGAKKPAVLADRGLPTCVDA
jgi:hypothetical protein